MPETETLQPTTDAAAMLTDRTPAQVDLTPPVSVLIGTRDRPGDIEMALPSVLAQDYPDYQVLVVDQSDGRETEQIVARLAERDGRLRYIRTNTRGLSRSRNIALSTASHDLCVFTDDDCVVPPDWLRRVAATFARHPETHILFGQVHPPADGDPNGYYAALHFSEAKVLRRGEVMGMGANMSMLRSFWQKVGPFDPMMGGGSILLGSEDFDWLYRAQRIGGVIRLDPDNVITHYGSRTAEQWRRVLVVYGSGDAAFALKHLRCGDLGRLGPLVGRPCLMLARLVYKTLRRRLHMEENYLQGYWRGFRLSLRYGVDRRTRLYEEGN